jgi:AraC family transcriptional regulator
VIPCASLPLTRKSKPTAGVPCPEDLARFPQRDISGEIIRLRRVGSFTLAETLYPAGLVLANHSHRQAFLTFVIEGTIHERYVGGDIVCRPGTVRFLPAGEVHENEVESSVRCLHISAEQSVLDGLSRQAAVPRQPAVISGLNVTWLANRLYAEFSGDDTASAIAMEGLILEVLAELARSQTRPERVSIPNWLKQATDIVEARFLERLSLTGIATEVGVHYVHLSRQFHKFNHCTIGELIRRRRVQHASHLLAHSHTPLAEIALICGFSDQSHLSFLFKRYMGMSPSKFRSLAGPDSGPQPIDEGKLTKKLSSCDQPGFLPQPQQILRNAQKRL